MTTAGIVLAAGGGTRFRSFTHKLLATYHGRPLVETAITAAAAAGLDDLVVVFGAVDLRSLCPAGVVAIDNPDWADGLATSLRVGINWCTDHGHDVAVIGLGDTPGVSSFAWQAVACTNTPVAVASFAGERRPPVRLERSVWHELPVSGDAGARALWHRDGVVEVPCDGDPTDVDTTDDLDKLSGTDPA